MSMYYDTTTTYALYFKRPGDTCWTPSAQDLDASGLQHWLFIRGLSCFLSDPDGIISQPAGDYNPNETWHRVSDFADGLTEYAVCATQAWDDKTNMLEEMVYFGDATASHIAYLELVVDHPGCIR